MKTGSIAKALGAALLAGVSAMGWAQAYPSKPIKVMVGFAPGGPADVIARLVAQGLEQTWPGNGVHVENRPGASGTIALRHVMGQPKDGHTLLFTSNSQLVFQLTNKAAGYDMNKDLVAVIKVASTPNAIVASNALGARTLKEVIELAKVRKLNFATAGNGTTPHLMLSYLFRGLAHVDIQHVPYAGAGPALTAVIGSQVELGGVALTPAIPAIKAGRVAGIAVTSSTRLPGLPEVPTVAEQGFPGFEDETWIGMFVGSGTSEALTTQLNAAVQKMLDTPAFKERLAELGFSTAGGSARSYQAFIGQDLQKWATYMKAAGIVPE